MKVLSVNISGAKPIKVGDREVKTGLLKEPQYKAVKISKLGLEGDVQVDKKNHGGKDQAVYFYTKEDYEFWEKELGKSLAVGLFGENLTVSGISSLNVRVGDRLEIADVILEVTAPRLPCAVFAARMDDQAFGKKFVNAGRAGFYCRVIKEGYVSKGDNIKMTPAKTGPTIKELSDLWVSKDKDIEQIKYVLSFPIDHRTRAAYEELVSKANAAGDS